MRQDLFGLLNSGAWLHAGANDLPEVTDLLRKCADTCHEINSLRPSMVEKRTELFRSLLGSVGEKFVIHSPFRCDFGCNIHIGENFVGNFNLSILDEAKVIIGDNVMIGPNCSLVTITHALLADQRNEGIMQANPITIGNNVWIASNVVILPDVTIGDGAVIGAGSVVLKSIPAGMLAVGNPCRPLRQVTDSDRVIPVF
ncbi:MAG: sugar O-acetyltransferase [Alistipes senegalensis]|nr:sugar O-acetyltransferase [Bacteroides cellulosilyticus]MCM1352807.1 sugar O-acetyltransferase [Alistipes senegalensis]